LPEKRKRGGQFQHIDRLEHGGRAWRERVSLINQYLDKLSMSSAFNAVSAWAEIYPEAAIQAIKDASDRSPALQRLCEAVDSVLAPLLRFSRQLPKNLFPSFPRSPFFHNKGYLTNCSTLLIMLNTDGSNISNVEKIEAGMFTLLNDIDNTDSPRNTDVLFLYQFLQEEKGRLEKELQPLLSIVNLIAGRRVIFKHTTPRCCKPLIRYHHSCCFR
jgi:hypothetical protein